VRLSLNRNDLYVEIALDSLGIIENRGFTNDAPERQKRDWRGRLATAIMWGPRADFKLLFASVTGFMLE